MKKIVIIALCIAAAWGCSDDTAIDPYYDNFPLIEGMVIIDVQGNSQDTLGDPEKVGVPCDNTGEYRVSAYPNISVDEIALNFIVPEAGEVTVRLETANLSKRMKDSLVAKFGGDYPDHENYKDEVVRTELLEAGEYTMTLDVNSAEAGAYLVKVKRKGVNEQCTPVIFARDIFVKSSIREGD